MNKKQIIQWYKENTRKSPQCKHYINSDKHGDGWKYCSQC